MISDIIRTDIEPGLLGFCDLIHDQMTAQGYEGDLDELRVISGAAVQHYIFEPAFNLHEEQPREFSQLALFFNNFGFFESLRYFSGWSIRDFNGVKLPDAWKLISWELSEGRAVVTADLEGRLEPALVVGLEPPRTLRARVRTGGLLADRTIDFSGRGNLQQDESFKNFFVIIRNDGDTESLVGPNRQKIELLRWLVTHHRSEKEFFHETRENYASGDRGFQRLERLMGAADDSIAKAYCREHVRFLTTGRSAASRVLFKWAGQLGELIDSAELEDNIAAAAEGYSRVAAECSKGDIVAARTAESDAVSAIERAAVLFPGRFEPFD